MATYRDDSTEQYPHEITFTVQAGNPTTPSFRRGQGLRFDAAFASATMWADMSDGNWAELVREVDGQVICYFEFKGGDIF